MTTPQQIGKLGESLAVQRLKKQGYKILARNFSNQWGEIDIVAKKKELIVFCEVKTIQQKQGFRPEDEIDHKKKKQLLRMSQIYLSEKKMSLEIPYQIDIISIELASESKKAKIRHFKNAIEDVC